MSTSDDTNTAGDPIRYEKLTWPEVDAAADDGKLVLVPTACVEDHGKHLPIDVDIEIVTNICRAVARRRDDVLVYPTIDNGYDPHHMHFPGTVSIDWDTFCNTLIDIGLSLAHHGFRKLLFLNGHGSNHQLVNQATRQIIIQRPDVQAAMLSWWQLDEVHDVVGSSFDGGAKGSAHAGELETSVYRYLHPDDVEMGEATDENAYPESPHFYQFGQDFTGQREPDAATPVMMMEWWSTISETGVMGNAAAATEEKGEAAFEAAVEGVSGILDDFATFPHREPVDHHGRDIPPSAYDAFRPR